MTTPHRNPQISVTLPPELHQKLLAAVKRDDDTIVRWVRCAIREKLGRREV